MTDIKKTEKDKGGAKAKKLQLNKETLQDLSARGPDANGIKGGRAQDPTMNRTPCPGECD